MQQLDDSVEPALRQPFPDNQDALAELFLGRLTLERLFRLFQLHGSGPFHLVDNTSSVANSGH